MLTPSYSRIQRMGGANDRGVDVAAFLTEQGFEGEWDCFQCKHYAKPLAAGDAWREIIKIFAAVVEGHYVMPRRYRFFAPQGCGKRLAQILNSPSQLRSEFMAELKPGSALTSGLDDELVDKIRDLAEVTDFSIFNTQDLVEALDLMKGTPAYLSRFGGRLPRRPARQQPPEQPTRHEARYLQQLVDVCREKWGTAVEDLASAMAHPKASRRIRRDRVAFYSAESLRVFARDSVPAGTFEGLQEDIYEGVIEAHDRDFNCGLDRLRAVLDAAMQLQIDANALITAWDLIDRKGIVHQLANVDRFLWCGEPDD
ncbi:ABC-three component system protein [Micromonospora echinofusca]|uniref:ABC-three component system protein n=1 Tax=Micromonospora echinofusca TaxID=47858 RepID=UPI003409C795